MIVVVPPNAAARVPVSKSSEAEVPPNGKIHMGVWIDSTGDNQLTCRIDESGQGTDDIR